RSFRRASTIRDPGIYEYRHRKSVDGPVCPDFGPASLGHSRNDDDTSRISGFAGRFRDFEDVLDRDCRGQRPPAPVLVGDFGCYLDVAVAAVEGLYCDSIFVG